MNGNEQEVTTVSNQVHSASRMKVKKIAFIGLMGAVSAVLMLMRFPIPFMPPFLSFVYLSQKEDKKKCCSRNGCQLLCSSCSCSSY